ncbi:MAG: AMP-binding protein [Acidobacteria bacterium]|nr:AMP-binding protein [Acidobacteriota bacterium]
MSRQTLLDYLDNFYRHGSDIAYAQRRGYRWVRWSYRQVAEAACALARELEARGIGRGDRVMIWGENSAEWVVAFLGCLLRGAVAVPMDNIASDDFALRVCRQVDARLLFGSRRHAGLDSCPATLVLEELPAVLARHSGQRYRPPDLRPEEAVEIVFTSGTTAEPKGVVISHRNILANLQPLEAEIDKYLRYERIVHPLRFLNLLPLSHVFGQFLGIFIPQLLAGAVIFQDSLNPAEIIRTVRHERVSVVVAVPRLLESLRDKVERDLEAAGRLEQFREQLRAAEGKHFLKRWWRFRQIHGSFGWKFWAFVSGGAALDPEVEMFWSRLGFLVIQGYGLTETTSLISVNHPLRPGKGSIGRILPGREVKLDENGEILVRGEGIASGYWRGKDLAPVAGEQGWFRTGDIGTLDEQGNLYFKGRKKNVIVTAEGMNVYPEDLEAELRRQPEVRDCVVLALAREGNAEPCAVLILRDASQDAEAVIRRANKSLASYQQIRHWFVWPEEDFPRTSTQKIRASTIQEVMRARMGGEASAAASGSTLGGLVARITGRPAGALSPDAKLAEDLNLSSIDRVELLSAIEDRYQLDVSDADFTAATTVGDLERMLREPALRRVDYDYATWPQRRPVTWVRLWIYYLMVWPATWLLAWPRIRGRQHLRGVAGPLLVVCNHITAVDIGFVLAALPPRLRHRLATAMEGEILRAMQHPPAEMGRLRRWVEKVTYVLVLGLFNVFPLPKRSGFRESFAFAGDLVDRGYSVLVFPEGMRTRDGRMAPFQAGIGLLANNLNVPVVPVRIDGLFELKKAGRRVAPPGAIKVSLGAPVQFQPGTSPEEIARHLQERVANLEQGAGRRPV